MPLIPFREVGMGVYGEVRMPFSGDAVMAEKPLKATGMSG